MTDATPKPEREKKTTCQHRPFIEGKGRRVCRNDGVPCWVIGEFGRIARNLCGRCIRQLRSDGWEVRYQLEGDNPPPLESSVTP